MGNYLKLFETHSEYETYIGGQDVILPNVSYCEDQNDVHYNPYVDPYNGHTYVDLGLPSGTLWATMNVGANSETDYGNYYMYGMGSKTYDSTDTPYAGTEDPLDLSRDTARQVWGGEWHTPTAAQFSELIANTTYEWVTNYLNSGIEGIVFTANGNNLFIPAAREATGGDTGGYYWTNQPNKDGYCHYLGLDATYNHPFIVDVDAFSYYVGGRNRGFSIRPVVG